MSMEQIIATAHALDGALVFTPEPGSDFPEVTWGDMFFYYAPDGRVPRNVQPYATIISGNHPDDATGLDAPGRRRVSIRAGRETFVRLTGEEPRALTRPRDHAAVDQVMPHPEYGALGWISVVDPGERTTDVVVQLLRAAHEAARARFVRRQDSGRPPENG